ncbi:unnamed protein product, partial [marine sediment metagenome]
LQNSPFNTGEAQQSLKDLGLEAKALRDAGPEATFFAISRAMDGVTNAGARAAIALKIFDDEQAAIHTTMQLTSGEYEKQIQLAKTLGVVVTEEQAKAAEQAADDLQVATAAWEGFWRMQITWSGKALSAWMGFTGAVAKNITGGGPAREGESMQARFQRNTREGFLGRREMKIATPADRARINAQRDAEAKAEADRLALIAENERKRTEAWGSFFRGLGPGILNEIKDSSPFDRFTPAEAAAVITPTMRVVQRQTDPMSSITAGTSEAFKFANQIKTSQSVEQEAAKTTATNTGNIDTKLSVLIDQNANATPLGL